MAEITLFDAIGVTGTALIIAAYFATQKGMVEARDWRFPFINLIGALLILVSLMADWNLAGFVMEVFWVAISLYGLVRARRARSSG
jgi:hypothetical protein